MTRRAAPIDAEDEPIEADGPDWRERMRDWVMQHPRDTVALLVAGGAAVTIAVNALCLQTGPHPAPLFALRLVAPREDAAAKTLPRPRPAVEEGTQEAQGQPRTRVQLVADIQRALAKRALYDGPVDGIYGPRTDASVRDFAQAARVKVGNEPSEALLDAIGASHIRETRAAPAASIPRRDPIADLIGPSSRILAVQRALTDYGYGQIKPTGVSGRETVEAIEKFERARRLPVTGLVSDRLMRELAAVTGRPLE
jgi:peptidoglycan hydrolase-like protein with peptidoglycan-binding domain